MESLFIQKHEDQNQLLNDNESSVKIFLFNVRTNFLDFETFEY